MIIDDYLGQLDEVSRGVFMKLRDVIKSHIPDGFEESFYCGMISFVVPHSIYPKGYHCKPTDPLPFISLGVNKRGLVLHHLALYIDDDLKKWFINEYTRQCSRKVDMGKGCVKFKYLNEIPFDLIRELVMKIKVEDWIQIYESRIMK